MDAVTYPDDDVQELLAERVIGFKPEVGENADLARRLGVTWTPGLVWLDPDGRACHRNVGFFEPREFQAECLLGCAHVAAAQGDWEAAGELFAEIAERFPRTYAAPAALYWAGVASKKATGEGRGLMRWWKQLLRSHTGNAWAMKVSFLEDEQAEESGKES
jgi:hypothetical protein